MIELIHVEKSYGSVTPLADVNAVINDGDVISIIGPSGTGKSTLIRCINMLDVPTNGKIILDGEEITAKGYDLSVMRKKVGMVFQQFNLFSHLTVIGNLMQAPMDILGKSKQEAYDTGIELLKRVGLAGRELQYPDQLSGGQQQRVAIARTLAMDPDVILLDEPTSALDPTMVGEVQSVIRDLAKSGKTMMIVTHEMNFARAICNRVFYMDQGGIYEDGTPEQIFEHPEKELTRRFIHKLKVLEIDVDSRDFDFIGANSDLERYCIENDISPHMKYMIRLAFEELVMQLLKPLLGHETIHITFEYSAEKKNCSLTAVYGGERLDPKDAGNDLSYKMLEHSVDELTYTYDENAGSGDDANAEGEEATSGANTVKATINE